MAIPRRSTRGPLDSDVDEYDISSIHPLHLTNANPNLHSSPFPYYIFTPDNDDSPLAADDTAVPVTAADAGNNNLHQHHHLQTGSPIGILSPQRILSPTRSDSSPLSPQHGNLNLPDIPSKVRTLYHNQTTTLS